MRDYIKCLHVKRKAKCKQKTNKGDEYSKAKVKGGHCKDVTTKVKTDFRRLCLAAMSFRSYTKHEKRQTLPFVPPDLFSSPK